MGGRQKKNSVGNGWAILRRLVVPYRPHVAGLAMASLFSALLEAAFIVLLTGIAMSLVEGQTRVGPVLGLSLPRTVALVLAGIALAFRVGLSLLAVRISAHLAAEITSAQRQRLSRAYLRASWEVQHSEPSGRLQELLTSFVTKITNAVVTLTNAITAGLSLVAFLASGFAMDPLSTGAVLLTLGIVSLVLIPLRRAIRRRSAREAQAGVAFASSVAELGSLGMEMQTFGAEEAFETLVDGLTLEASGAQRRRAVLSGAMPHVYISLAYAAVLGAIAVLSNVEIASYAALGAILILMLRSISYGQQLSTASASLVASLPFLEQVEETTERYTATWRLESRERPLAVTPIRTEDVGFGYTPDRMALAGVSFTLNKGEALGVIGPSGAGKSTLAQIMLGLRMPTRGSIQVGEEELAAVDRDWWTKRVAFVPQEALLFTGTVADNIRFFRPGLGAQDLREAAAKANVLRDIDALPNGFDTHLGQRGSQLSGGQKQRLSIARALVGIPELLILDEPTSALDGQSESLIRDTLAQLKGDMTIVIIAHRMSTLDICDRIMVVERGVVSALGTPLELEHTSAFYRQALTVAGLAQSHGGLVATADARSLKD